jgi:hypothetical protein
MYRISLNTKVAKRCQAPFGGTYFYSKKEGFLKSVLYIYNSYITFNQRISKEKE